MAKMLRNVKFSYLYRDAGNYKNSGEVVLSNPESIEIESVRIRLTRAFEQGDLFLADQVRVPEVFLFREGCATSDDHCFHEFRSVEPTSEPAHDKHHRSISQLVAEVERESATGWRCFDVHEPRRRRTRASGGLRP
jgi:hypothetical protein